MSDDKTILTDTEWQQASTVLALIRDGHKDMYGLRKALGCNMNQLSQLLTKLDQLELTVWLDGKPYCTPTGLQCCQLIKLVKADSAGNLRPLKGAFYFA